MNLIYMEASQYKTHEVAILRHVPGNGHIRRQGIFLKSAYDYHGASDWSMKN